MTGVDDGTTEDTPSARANSFRLLDEGIQEAHRKDVSGRVYDPENEKVEQLEQQQQSSSINSS